MTTAETVCTPVRQATSPAVSTAEPPHHIANLLILLRRRRPDLIQKNIVVDARAMHGRPHLAQARTHIRAPAVARTAGATSRARNAARGSPMSRAFQ
jgi:hypothetical protein